jgi:branched-chain amino acid transport system substrate-binding protein
VRTENAIQQTMHGHSRVKEKFMKRLILTGLLATSFAAADLISPAAYAGDTEQYVPLPTYRVGAYASSGTLWWAGEIDYFRYINEVEGGINGVKLKVEEFETEWSPDRTVEVYERVKNGKDGAPVAFFFTHGTPATYALTERAVKDKIPLVDPAGGQPEATNGLVFSYVFPLLLPGIGGHQLYRAEGRWARQTEGEKDRHRLS